MKTAQALFREHGIASLADLERALDAGCARRTRGWGQSRSRISNAAFSPSRAPQRARRSARALRWRARSSPILRAGARAGRSRRGSLRRQESTVGDIDIVCTRDDAEAVIARFTAGSAPKPCSPKADQSDDLARRRIADRPARAAGGRVRQSAAALHRQPRAQHSTARTRRAQGCGSARTASSNSRPANSRPAGPKKRSTPRSDCRSFPPEMRLGIGEIDAALDGTLPEPVELGDLRGDFHMHCTWSDGADTLEAMIAAAAARGYAYHAISDHSGGRGSIGLDPAGLRAQRDASRHRRPLRHSHAVLRARSTSGRTARSTLATTSWRELDIVIASVHSAHASLARGDDAAPDSRLRASVRHHHRPSDAGGSRAFDGYEFDLRRRLRGGGANRHRAGDRRPAVRLDLPSASRARAASASPSLDSDAHAADQLANVEYAIGQARRAWVAQAKCSTRGRSTPCWRSSRRSARGPRPNSRAFPAFSKMP